MLLVAVGGLVGNIVMARLLGGGHADLNMRSAWLHVMGDIVTSAGVIIAGLVIRFTGWRLADPIASAMVGVIIIFGGSRVIKEALWIFLELSPLGFHAEDISKTICGMEHVLGVHDVHIWSIGHGVPAFSAHVLLNDRKISETDLVRREIEEKLCGSRHKAHGPADGVRRVPGERPLLPDRRGRGRHPPPPLTPCLSLPSLLPFSCVHLRFHGFSVLPSSLASSLRGSADDGTEGNARAAAFCEPHDLRRTHDSLRSMRLTAHHI